MFKTYNFKTALMSLFIKSLGSGFSTLISDNYCSLSDNDIPNFSYNTLSCVNKITPNNFKQKFKKINSGDKKTYDEIRKTMFFLTELFTEPQRCAQNNSINDDFCQAYSSNKYQFSFRYFFYVFLPAYIDEHFFYESFENALSYLFAKGFERNFKEENCVEYDANLAALEQQFKKGWYKSKEEYEERKLSESRCSRREYGSCVNDVRFNKKENKTFFKWVIDEFYARTQIADEIIKCVFGENDGNLTTTFQKLKYESGKRSWTIFENLFKNELKNEKLMKLLENEEELKAYQIFQARMFSAFFLENLFAELPNFVGKENALKIQKIIVGDESFKNPEDFLIPNHDEKTEAYEQEVFEIMRASHNEKTKRLEELDKNCPATETLKALITLLNPEFYWELSNGRLGTTSLSSGRFVKDVSKAEALKEMERLKNAIQKLHFATADFDKYLEICRENRRYLEYFSDRGCLLSFEFEKFAGEEFHISSNSIYQIL